MGGIRQSLFVGITGGSLEQEGSSSSRRLCTPGKLWLPLQAFELVRHGDRPRSFLIPLLSHRGRYPLGASQSPARSLNRCGRQIMIYLSIALLFPLLVSGLRLPVRSIPAKRSIKLTSSKGSTFSKLKPETFALKPQNNQVLNLT